VFVTTTCLDFVHAFRREEMRTRLARRLASDHEFYGAVLHAYVVMPHHTHFVSQLPEGRDVGWFLQRIKANSAKELLPYLTPEESQGFDMQRGLDKRTFWQRSFRSVVVLDEPMFHQKVWYVHQNPVRAGYVAEAEEYAWSSAAIYGTRLYLDPTGLAAEVLRTLPPLA
jgi:REP element-mobilizing transposase RayT